MSEKRYGRICKAYIHTYIHGHVENVWRVSRLSRLSCDFGLPGIPTHPGMKRHTLNREGTATRAYLTRLQTAGRLLSCDAFFVCDAVASPQCGSVVECQSNRSYCSKIVVLTGAVPPAHHKVGRAVIRSARKHKMERQVAGWYIIIGQLTMSVQRSGIGRVD
jgi:hypothetical protein